jgi:hypothetical protein
VVSRATSAWSRPGRRAARQAIGYGPQFIEHDGDVPRHVDLIGCGMAGLSLLDGALDVKVKGMRKDGQDASDRRLTARTVPMTGRPSLSSTLRVLSPPANLIGVTLSCRLPNRLYGKWCRQRGASS